jgi:Recombination endonuclease VII
MTPKKRDTYLKKKYGVGIKEYKRMFSAQNGVCAVCKRPPKKKKNLHVDHDHFTGEVRGLLCYYCNRRIIGRNTEKSIRQLVAYLMPDYDLQLNNGDSHFLEMQTRHVVCNCLLCVRYEVNFENKLLKPESQG